MQAFVPRWGADDDGAFRRRPRGVTSLLALDEVTRSAERDAVLAAIARNPTASSRLGSTIGDAYMRRRFDADDLCRALAIGAMAHGDDPEFDASQFDRVYSWVERQLLSESQYSVFLIPLAGLLVDGGTVELLPGVEVDRLSTDEVVRSLEVGVISGRFDVFNNDPPICGIRVTSEMPLVIGDEAQSSDALAASARALRSTTKQAELALIALRLLNSGGVSPIARLRFVDGDAVTQFAELGTLGLFPRTTFALHDTDADELLAIAKSLDTASVQNQGALQNALRRFSDAGARSRSDDQLVDLMIAAESLFFQRNERELSFRLSLRGAWFLAQDDPSDRVSVFTRLKNAYDLRSRIVHGTSMSHADRASIDATALDVEMLIRMALRRALNEISLMEETPAEIADWRSLELGALSGAPDVAGVQN